MKYKINKIFYSIQGEGARSGTPQVFLRFSGCNLKCSFCDTNHETFELITSRQILNQCISISKGCRNISFCGGEPTLQLDREIIKKFNGWYKSIETNGTNKVIDGIDYIVCSPKKKLIKPKKINELRYVLKKNDELPKINRKNCQYYLSPCFDGEEPNWDNIKYCVRMVQENPQFKLNIQLHKFIKID
jgi:organic radical activating enzyme